ncbi:hypothetical protein PIB30_043449 [Stylosanthes scabra]|uniref:Uncharacterized protein n=1 Tax=Stylosanthes scabra TaxID=79078 RepID=A0ABU6XEC0_9FABA|nr:hypothetical protein [Stylosanthes scabra]
MQLRGSDGSPIQQPLLKIGEGHPNPKLGEHHLVHPEPIGNGGVIQLIEIPLRKDWRSPQHIAGDPSIDDGQLARHPDSPADSRPFLEKPNQERTPPREAMIKLKTEEEYKRGKMDLSPSETSRRSFHQSTSRCHGTRGKLDNSRSPEHRQRRPS